MREEFKREREQMMGGGERVMGATALNNKTFAPLAILKYFKLKMQTDAYQIGRAN